MSNITITQEEYDQLLQAKAFQESAVGKVLVSQVELDDLNDDALFLACLQGAGVDNWSGYSYAWEDYEASKSSDNDE